MFFTYYLLLVTYYLLLNQISGAKANKQITMGVERLELSRPLRSTDFKSVASTIPPHPLEVVKEIYWLN